VGDLKINALRTPKNNDAFVKELLIRYDYLLETTRHYKRLKESLDLAMNWLNSNFMNNVCPRYSILHGDYSPVNALVTKDSKMIIIDWESVVVGDPAFDVGFAYHAIKLLRDYKHPSCGENDADRFISQYIRNYQGEIQNRLEFYKVLSLLGLAIEFSNLLSNPIEAYKCFGYKTLLSFPFLRIPFVAQRSLGTDFMLYYLRYFEDFLGASLKR
jgi:aminoglycoside phosphotransferase (APT) family kinase protein